MWGGIYKNNLDYALRNNLSIEELSDTRFVKKLSKDIRHKNRHSTNLLATYGRVMAESYL